MSKHFVCSDIRPRIKEGLLSVWCWCDIVFCVKDYDLMLCYKKPPMAGHSHRSDAELQKLRIVNHVVCCNWNLVGNFAS